MIKIMKISEDRDFFCDSPKNQPAANRGNLLRRHVEGPTDGTISAGRHGSTEISYGKEQYYRGKEQLDHTTESLPSGTTIRFSLHDTTRFIKISGPNRTFPTMGREIENSVCCEESLRHEPNIQNTVVEKSNPSGLFLVFIDMPNVLFGYRKQRKRGFFRL